MATVDNTDTYKDAGVVDFVQRNHVVTTAGNLVVGVRYGHALSLVSYTIDGVPMELIGTVSDSGTGVVSAFCGPVTPGTRVVRVELFTSTSNFWYTAASFVGLAGTTSDKDTGPETVGGTNFDLPSVTTDQADSDVVAVLFNNWSTLTGVRKNTGAGASLVVEAYTGGSGAVSIIHSTAAVAAATNVSLGGNQSVTPPTWMGHIAAFNPAAVVTAKPWLYRSHTHLA
jgi:hypothetical protein